MNRQIFMTEDTNSSERFYSPSDEHRRREGKEIFPLQQSILKAFDQLEYEGKLYSPRPDHYKVVEDI